MNLKFTLKNTLSIGGKGKYIVSLPVRCEQLKYGSTDSLSMAA